MTRFNPLWTLLLFLTFAATGCDRLSEAPTVESSPTLLGVWRVVGIGDKKLADIGVELRWTFGEEEIVVSDGDGQEISRSRYRTDTSHDPCHITMEIQDIVEETRPGIFEIDGNRLRLSFSVDSGPRPMTLADGESMILERMIGPDL